MSARIEDQQVRDALEGATAPLQPAPTLLPQLHRRIHRTRIRRRFERAGIGLAVATVAVVAVTQNWAGVGRTTDNATPVVHPPANSDLLNRPLGGDLRGDQVLVASFMSTWTDYDAGRAQPQYGGSESHLATPRHLAWVGSTPVGPAAIGVQPRQQGGLAVTYFVAGTGGSVRVAGSGPIRVPGATFGGVLLDADRKVLLSYDTRQPMEYSVSRTNTPDGHVSRTYELVDYVDGAAVVPLPGGPASYQFDLRKVGGSAVADRPYVLNAAGNPLQGHDASPGYWDGLVFRLTPGVRPPSWDALSERFNDALYRTGYLGESVLGEGAWFGYGVLPGGREVIAGEYQLDDVSRTYAVLFTPGAEPRVVYGQVIDRTAAVPVRIDIPDRLGWVVIGGRGVALSWPGGNAQDAGLAPAATSMVTARANGGAPQQVPLTH